MDSEINSLKQKKKDMGNKPLSQGEKAQFCKWVIRMKKNPDDTVKRYKARLVIKGLNQRKGIDYHQTFSSVTKLGTVRSLISIAASEKMSLMQFDVSTAFLYGDLDETIYVKQSEGYNDGMENVCKLKRSLKQAPRWQHKCSENACQISKADQCLFIREKEGRKILVALYVDDGLIAATHEEDSKSFIT